MKPERMTRGESGALGAMTGLIVAIGVRFVAGETVGVGVILLCGLIGAGIGLVIAVWMGGQATPPQ